MGIIFDLIVLFTYLGTPLNNADQRNLKIKILSDSISCSSLDIKISYLNTSSEGYYLPAQHFKTMQNFVFDDPYVGYEGTRPNFVLDEKISSDNPEANCSRFDKSNYTYLAPFESVVIKYNLNELDYKGFQKTITSFEVILETSFEFENLCDSILVGSFKSSSKKLIIY